MQASWATRIAALVLGSSLAACADGGSDTSVPLGSVWREVTHYCQLGANKTGYEVPCPTLAPVVEHPSRRWELCRGTDGHLEGRGCPRDSFVFEERFIGPPGYAGISGASEATRFGHLVIWAARGTVPIDNRGIAQCPDAHLLGDARLDGHQGRWYTCSEGIAALDAGHLLFMWTDANVTYAVSAHRNTPTNRILIERVVSRLAFVRP